MTKPDISVIIVNWRVRPLVEKCLKSIYTHRGSTNLEIIVVDNDSHDTLAEMLMMDFPEVKLVGLSKNYGFAKANNFAIKQAQGRIICLLNPDTEVTAGFFEGLLVYFDSQSEVSIIGPRLINPDGSLQHSVRKTPSWLAQVFVLLKLQNIINEKSHLEKYFNRYFLPLALKLKNALSNNKIVSDYLASDFDYDREQEVDQLMGAALLIRREVFAKIGYLDEHFFIWFEEVDFCRRAKKAGLVIKYVPLLKVIHHGGASFKLAPTMRKQWIFDRSLVYYFWKHHAWWQALLITCLVPVNLLLTLIYVSSLKKH